LVWKPEGKRLLGRPKHKWVNTEINLKWLWECGLDSSGSRFCAVVGSYEHGNKLSDSIKCSRFPD
jgi:hypothetical protein